MPKFQIGDTIVINSKARGVYNITVPGTVGVIVQTMPYHTNGEYYLVHFTTDNGRWNGNLDAYGIYSEYMDLVHPQPSSLDEHNSPVLRKIKTLENRFKQKTAYYNKLKAI